MRRWRRFARIGEAICQKQELVATFMMIAQVEALHKWRSMAREKGRGNVQYGAAIMMMFHRALRIAWIQWRFNGAEEFDGMVNMRRAAVRLTL